MTTEPPDDLPPELLAAYADGELSAADRAARGAWLAENPQAANFSRRRSRWPLETSSFGRPSRRPQPTPAKWANSLEHVNDAMPNRPRTAWAGWAGRSVSCDRGDTPVADARTTAPVPADSPMGR